MLAMPTKPERGGKIGVLCCPQDIKILLFTNLNDCPYEGTFGKTALGKKRPYS